MQGMENRRGRRPSWAAAPLPSPVYRFPSCAAHQSSPPDKQGRGHRCRGDLGHPRSSSAAGHNHHERERRPARWRIGIGYRRGQHCCSSRRHGGALWRGARGGGDLYGASGLPKQGRGRRNRGRGGADLNAWRWEWDRAAVLRRRIAGGGGREVPTMPPDRGGGQRREQWIRGSKVWRERGPPMARELYRRRRERPCPRRRRWRGMGAGGLPPWGGWERAGGGKRE
jgi:hypothetical protein